MSNISIKNKELTNYYNAVKKELHCPKVIKKRILHSLESDVADFIEEHSSLDEQDLIEHFGAPQDFAVESLSAMDENELNKAIHKSKWIKRGIIIVVTAIVALATVATIWIITENSQSVAYYYEEVITDEGIIE